MNSVEVCTGTCGIVTQLVSIEYDESDTEGKMVNATGIYISRTRVLEPNFSEVKVKASCPWGSLSLLLLQADLAAYLQTGPSSFSLGIN